MNNKIGIISDSLRLNFKESMRKCAELGADGVQIYAVEGEISPESMTSSDIAEKKDIISGNGLVISALCGDLGGHGFERQKDNIVKIERSKRILDLALKLGTNIVTTHIGVLPEDSSADKYKIMQEACNTLANYAHENGAFFAIETGPEPASRLKAFLDSLDSKGVAVNFDPANLVMVTGDDPVEGVYILKDYIVHTHAKDGRQLKKADPVEVYGFFAEGGIGDLRLDEYFIEVPLGQGDVDFGGWLGALNDIGYQGFLTIEREVGENPAADIAGAIEFLKTHSRYKG